MSKQLLENTNLTQLIPWYPSMYSPDTSNQLELKTELNYPRPILINVGQLLPQKNIDDFCQLNITGTLIVIGKGPELPRLQTQYPNIKFIGAKYNSELHDWYSIADCLVFTSTNDAFGLVMIEAMCSGTPVAAYNQTASIDVIQEGVTGYLADYRDINSLTKTVLKCLNLDRNMVKTRATQCWNSNHSLDIILQNIHPINPQLWQDKWQLIRLPNLFCNLITMILSSLILYINFSLRAPILADGQINSIKSMLYFLVTIIYLTSDNIISKLRN